MNLDATVPLNVCNENVRFYITPFAVSVIAHRTGFPVTATESGRYSGSNLLTMHFRLHDSQTLPPPGLPPTAKLYSPMLWHAVNFSCLA